MTNGSCDTTIRATATMKSDFCRLPQMQTLKENIINSNNKITAFNNEINNLETEITTQRNVTNQAKADNDAKLNFNNSIQLLAQTDFSKIISVVVNQQEFEDAMVKIRELQNRLNATNINSEEQEKKLADLQTKLNNKKAALNTEAELLASYKLQLKVNIDRQRQELNEMEALLNDNNVPIPRIQWQLPNGENGNNNQ